MLEPGRRRLFLDTLRPPNGYLLSRAVGTTFTLDLMALLSVPLAFTFRDAQDGEGQLAIEPLTVLEGARRSWRRRWAWRPVRRFVRRILTLGLWRE